MTSFAVCRLVGESVELARETARTFEHRFSQNYGKAMRVDFDRETQKAMSDLGFPNSRVLQIGQEQSAIRLCVFFDTLRLDEAEDGDLLNFQDLAKAHSFDRTILLRSQWHPSLHKAASSLDRIYLMSLGNGVPPGKYLFTEYYYDPDLGPEQRLRTNYFVEKIIAKMGKIFHIALANLAAPKYDAEYGKASFGTELAMKAEEQIIGHALESVAGGGRAADLGCGTGRHSFLLAEKFRQVMGYDFSSGMIDVANKKKRKLREDTLDYSRVRFEVRDVEDVPLRESDGEFDFVLGSFGMGSFVEELQGLLQAVAAQLRRDGLCILSFYNKEALRYVTPPPWRDSTLSAELVRGRDELEVTLSTGERFTIFCRAYTAQDLEGHLAAYFNNVTIASSSALASFLPAQLFTAGSAAQKAKEIIGKIDKELQVAGLMNGAYFTAVCRDPKPVRKEQSKRVRKERSRKRN